VTPPVIHVVGFSGAGKTTLLTALTRRLTRAGYRVGTLKHHHATRSPVARERSTNDTARHADAGAHLTALVGSDGAVVRLLGEVTFEPVASLYTPLVDVILAEGFTTDARVAISVVDARGRERPVPRRCKLLARIALTPGGRVPARALAEAVAAIRALV
jgi:molybdopterin-guanine dinucleotide biosynthesis protein B